ncbi:hypothetical protein SARC_05715 [Sphaeroforma arctica JP610]|uniref:F-box domain-containing protein n=1 Tax=Sphaeroforma arctica JP610 TaxID=667725 RepID=A0A0L0FZJ7_9EUKA|nr:hypothetical protein SARC_05715 [Sphaeroforma arctica JP610]KNC81986.1 hypothetical protein SARC_05715 [Sphaeroforma arctica JP610]|eukprot:XP_014155888.1 hypothetical protein SARC_05715 [Sphaeroforma arctica JP610]
MSYNITTRTRETVYDEKAADMAMAQLEALDCGTLLSMLARMHKLVAEKTRHHLRRCGAALPIYAAGKQIPSEVMVKVFDWLDYDSVREYRLVSRSFYAVLCDQRLWTEIPDVAYGTGGRLDRATVDLSKTIEVARHYPRLQKWYIPRELDFHAASSDVLDANDPTVDPYAPHPVLGGGVRDSTGGPSVLDPSHGR